MARVFEKDGFFVESPDRPLMDRSEGGHLIIAMQDPVTDRQHLSPRQAIALMRLTVVTGAAMATVLNANGVDVGRVNYQDNGNWSVFKPGGPRLHVHLYGRAKSAKTHPYGHAVYHPHKEEHPELYAGLKPLTGQDVKGIRREIERLFGAEKFSDAAWGLDRLPE